MRQSKKKQKAKALPNRARVQFDFSRESLQKFDDMVKKVNAHTRGELIRRALTLYAEFLAAEERGAKVCFREADGTLVPVVMIF